MIPEKPVSALFKRISISLELTSDLENCHINNLFVEWLNSTRVPSVFHAES